MLILVLGFIVILVYYVNIIFSIHIYILHCDIYFNVSFSTNFCIYFHCLISLIVHITDFNVTMFGMGILLITCILFLFLFLFYILILFYFVWEYGYFILFIYLSIFFIVFM